MKSEHKSISILLIIILGIFTTLTFFGIDYIYDLESKEINKIKWNNVKHTEILLLESIFREDSICYSWIKKNQNKDSIPSRLDYYLSRKQSNTIILEKSIYSQCQFGVKGLIYNSSNETFTKVCENNNLCSIEQKEILNQIQLNPQYKSAKYGLFTFKDREILWYSQNIYELTDNKLKEYNKIYIFIENTDRIHTKTINIIGYILWIYLIINIISIYWIAHLIKDKE